MKNLIVLTGMYCGYIMGAAFASGQEMLQFFSSFGYKGYAGAVIYLLLNIFVMRKLLTVSAKENFREPYDCFPYFCGSRIGKIFPWGLIIILVLDMIMMTSSAGANLEENLGMPIFAGRLIVFAGAGVVLLGLNKIVDVVSKIGPFIIVFMLFLAIVSLISSPYSVSEGNAVMGSLDVYTGSSNFIFAALKFFGFCLLSNIPIIIVCGLNCRNEKEARIAGILLPSVYTAVCLVLISAQISNISRIYDYQIPNLRLIALYMPALKEFFSIVLLICTFGSITVMIWTVIRKFSSEKTLKYNAGTVGLSVCTFFLSGVLPFNRILNIDVTVGMVMGLIFCLFVICRSFKD